MKMGKPQIRRTLAFAKREFKLRTRYKWSFISTVFVLPLLHAAPIVILYAGLMGMVGGVEEVTGSNYLTWVLLGSVFYSTFSLAYGVFRRRFTEEKYWMTIDGTLIAPISKYYLLFGVIIELAVEGIIMSLPFMIMSYIVMPTAFINILFIYLIFLITLITGAGISIVGGAMYLIDENLVVFFDYGLFIIIFLSTYFIPFDLYPAFLQIFVFINPLYHFINISRNAWFGFYSIDIFWSFLFLVIICVVCVVLGIYIFNKTTRRFGVRGY